MHIQADLTEFLATVSDASGQIRPLALCERLRITPAQLAASIGVS
ncbi:hypothetical protein [Sabulicella rubraurantiaca]|nr:hypothetical protein [Sabulicella rubraurantiaca]